MGDAYSPIQNFSGHRPSSLQLLSSSLSRIISSTSEDRAPKTSARISLAVSSSWRLGFTAGIGALGLRLSRQGHLMRRPPRWSGLPVPPRCFRPCSAQLPAYHRSRRPGRRARPWLPGAGPMRGRKGGWSPPSRPASWPRQRGPPYPWPFRRAGGCAPLSGRGGDSPPGWSYEDGY